VSLHTLSSVKGRRLRGAVAIAVTVMAISGLHYVTSLHSVVLHEVFKRLYYVPIVIAAVTTGFRGGLGASLVSTLLYLPHVAMRWHAWPVLEVEQYGEMLMFNVVAIVTGMLADRLRAERDQCRLMAGELWEAYASLGAQTDERLRVDRDVTIGRIASGIAHEIRTPLAGLLGCLEILGSEFPRAHPKAEFIDIALREIARLQGVVTEFLEFAHPAPPTVQRVDLRLPAETAARLAQPAFASRDVDLEVRVPPGMLPVYVDVEQLQRALLSILLSCAPSLRDGRVVLTIRQAGDIGQLTVEFEGSASQSAAGDVFEPFPTAAHGGGLALATARRLIENQHGTVRAEVADGRFRCVISLPVAKPAPSDAVGRPPETPSLA
jgi:two-component system, NtrC family, sensor histidine kinase HydH